MKKIITLLLFLLPALLIAQDSTRIAPDTISAAPSIPLIRFPDTPLLINPVPQIYKKWWKDMERCTKLTVSDSIMDNTQFYMVIAPYFNVGSEHNSALAVTFPMLNSIYISADYITTKEIVEHEILHVLLYHAGLKFWEHDPKYFGKGKCAMTADEFVR